MHKGLMDAAAVFTAFTTVASVQVVASKRDTEGGLLGKWVAGL
jgi:hypothetical protein